MGGCFQATVTLEAAPGFGTVTVTDAEELVTLVATTDPSEYVNVKLTFGW